MKVWIMIVALIILTLYESREFRVPKSYNINLDLDYELRWSEFITENKELL